MCTPYALLPKSSHIIPVLIHLMKNKIVKIIQGAYRISLCTSAEWIWCINLK